MEIKSCDSCTRIPYGIFQIFSFSIIILIITLIVSAYHMSNIWKSDWDRYRCNLNALPFASLIDKSKSVTTNFQECLKMKTSPIVKAYTKYKMDKKVNDSIAQNNAVQKDALDTAMEIQESKSFLERQFDEIKKYFDKLLFINKYISHKIQNFFYKIIALIWSTYFYLITNINTVILQVVAFQRMFTVLNTFSILLIAFTAMYPPLLPLTVIMTAIVVATNVTQTAAEKRAYCCFSPDSKIILNDNQIVQIKDIKLNDVIKNNSIVTGIVQTYSKNTPMYKFKNAWVTHDHYVLNGNNWILAETFFNNPKTKNSDQLFCLVTSNNIITSSDGYIFKDYEETSSSSIQSTISSYILNSLNKNNINSESIFSEHELGERNNCLPPNSLVKMQDNKYKEIKDIQIGDYTNTGKVIGKYICLSKNIKWFTIGNNNIISPRIIFFNKFTKKWDKFYNHPLCIPSNYKCNISYHLITDSHFFHLKDDVIVRDFIETNCNEAQLNISKLVDNHINFVQKPKYEKNINYDIE